MKRINILLAIGVFSILILCLPGVASAQYGQYDPYGRNGGYNNGGYNNGGYNNGQYGDMRSVVRDLKNRASDFQRLVDRDYGRSRYGIGRRDNEITWLARDFKNAVKKLNGNGNYNRNQSNDVSRVLDLGSQIDRSLSRNRVDYNAQNVWSGIRYDLNALSGSYGYNNRNNRGYYPNNRYPQNSRNNLPTWWPF